MCSLCHLANPVWTSSGGYWQQIDGRDAAVSGGVSTVCVPILSKTLGLLESACNRSITAGLRADASLRDLQRYMAVFSQRCMAPIARVLRALDDVAGVHGLTLRTLGVCPSRDPHSSARLSPQGVLRCAARAWASVEPVSSRSIADLESAHSDSVSYGAPVRESNSNEGPGTPSPAGSGFGVSAIRASR